VSKSQSLRGPLKSRKPLTLVGEAHSHVVRNRIKDSTKQTKGRSLIAVLKALPAVKQYAEKKRQACLRMHTNISVWDAHGRRISRVYDADLFYKTHRCRTTTPSKDKLFNFNLTFGGKTLLVLDNYGAEHLPKEIEKRMLQGCTTDNDPRTGVTLGIDRKTGDIFLVGFGREGRETIAIVWNIDTHRGSNERLVVPKELLRSQTTLNTLMSKKRPFYLTLDVHGLFAFIEREIGYQELEKYLTVGLNLDPQTVEISETGHRKVGSWK